MWYVLSLNAAFGAMLSLNASFCVVLPLNAAFGAPLTGGQVNLCDDICSNIVMCHVLMTTLNATVAANYSESLVLLIGMEHF